MTQPVLPTSSSRPGASIATRLLPQCCVCGLIRDETGSRPGGISWITLGSYRRLRQVRATALYFTHGYCPACFQQAQTAMREHFRGQEGRDHD